MEFVVAVVAALVMCNIVLFARGLKVAYQLRRRHLESLFHVQDMVKLGFPGSTSERLFNTIDGEIEAIHV